MFLYIKFQVHSTRFSSNLHVSSAMLAFTALLIAPVQQTLYAQRDIIVQLEPLMGLKENAPKEPTAIQLG